MEVKEKSDLRWFVDAWAVRDGRMFASLRNPESIDARSTIFLSVPDLEPVPVGRISTALRATRSGFQEGFRDSSSNTEIPFESVEQLRELCRRGFLGGGLGPGAPGVGPLPYAVPPEAPDAGGIGMDDFIPEPLFVDEWSPHALAETFRAMHPSTLDAYGVAVQRVFRAVVETWPAGPYNREGSPPSFDAARQRCIGWLIVQGVLPHDFAFLLAEEIGVHLVGHQNGVLPDWPSLESQSVRLHPNDLALIPFPVRWHGQPVTRLSELVILGSITEDFIQGETSADQLVPLAAHYVARRAAQRFPVFPDGPKLVSAALMDVAQNAPAVRLPDSANVALGLWTSHLLEANENKR